MNLNFVSSIRRSFYFFEYYNQYEFLEGQIANYHHFFQEYKTHEQTRKLLLQLLSNNHYPFKRQNLYTKINLKST
ncbi:YxiJ-like family protein [Lysinibacillus sp. GbtcB16]|uniref:YxiJ-like family protein n=1 Tax=Lysinibacillus sp. GbtcB16 TaxID=2824761 RepID=UPI001C30C877